MPGINTLFLNQETMVQAMQQYLNKNILKPPTVVSVTYIERDNRFGIVTKGEEDTRVKL